MGRSINEIRWDSGKGIEELRAWGIEPCLVLIEIIANASAENPRICTLALLVETLLKEMDSKISDFCAEWNEAGGVDIEKK